MIHVHTHGTGYNAPVTGSLMHRQKSEQQPDYRIAGLFCGRTVSRISWICCCVQNISEYCIAYKVHVRVAITKMQSARFYYQNPLMPVIDEKCNPLHGINI